MTLNVPNVPKNNLTYHFTMPLRGRGKNTIPSASSPHLIKNQMIFMM